MLIEISKELEKYLIFEYPTERLSKDAPKEVEKEFEEYLKVKEEYNKKY